MERLSVSESISKRWITLNSEVVGGPGGGGTLHMKGVGMPVGNFELNP